MLNQLRIGRRGPGRPRTRPVLVRADKAYSARGTRGYLRRRGIKAVIPEPADQAGHRKRRGSRGGRPVSYDRLEYAGRNVVERGFNVLKQWRALATRYDKHALTYRGGLVLAAILTWINRLQRHVLGACPEGSGEPGIAVASSALVLREPVPTRAASNRR
jgi:transposase